MNSGFLKRATSSLIDMTLVLIIVGITFLAFGKRILINQIPNFNEIYASYTDVMNAYNEDLAKIQDDYNAQVELANGDEEKENEAEELYQARSTVLNNQNLLDIDPYNRPLTRYYLNNIYYFCIGFLLLTAIYTVAMNGKTVGRRLMKTQLEGNVNLISIFFHDVILKYFFVILVLIVNFYYGIMLLGLTLIIDVILISFRKNKTTLRDLLTGIQVTNSNYWR